MGNGESFHSLGNQGRNTVVERMDYLASRTRYGRTSNHSKLWCLLLTCPSGWQGQERWQQCGLSDSWDSQTLPTPQNDLHWVVSVSDGREEGGGRHMLPLVPDFLLPNILLLPALRGWEGCDEQEDCICQGRGWRLRGQEAPGFLPE